MDARVDKAAGAELRILPPYSPDFNLMENACAKLQTLCAWPPSAPSPVSDPPCDASSISSAPTGLRTAQAPEVMIYAGGFRSTVTIGMRSHIYGASPPTRTLPPARAIPPNSCRQGDSSVARLTPARRSVSSAGLVGRLCAAAFNPFSRRVRRNSGERSWRSRRQSRSG